jgi:hypothetical protein
MNLTEGTSMRERTPDAPPGNGPPNRSTHASLLRLLLQSSRPQVAAAALVAALAGADLHGQQIVPALVDRDLSVAAGASLANAAGEIVEQLERRVVPDALVAERGAGRRSINVAYRTAKLLLFDRPQEEWLMVANHELFGHGGRVRELFDGFVKYRLDPPAPFGRGGGATFYQLTRDYGILDVQAISVCGMEANGVAAEQIARLVFRRGEWSPRTALRYVIFELDAFEYIQKTDDEPERAGHDVSDFLQNYNDVAEAVSASVITPRMLRRRSLLSLANPVLASAVFGIGRYLVTGRTDARVLAIPIRSLRVMPALRYRLAPYGPEWSLTTDVESSGRIGQIVVRSAQAPNATPWGLGLTYTGVAVGNWVLDVSLDGWRQPPLAVGPMPHFGIELIGAGMEWGGRVRARAEAALAPLWSGGRPMTLIVDAALKSPGFLPGEPLAEGLVLRAGIGLPLGPP